MKSISCLFVALTLIISPAVTAASVPTSWADPHVLTMPRHSPIVGSELQRLINRLPDDSSVAVWIFFTDKGIFDSSTLSERLAQAENGLSETARQRRAKSRGADNLVDFRDLPVNQAYVDQILSTGSKLRHVLRWFNAATVNASRSQIESIAQLSFVRLIKKVEYSSSNIDVETGPIPDSLALISLDYGPSYAQLEQINVVAAHELGFKGQDVIVCMMDTGYRHYHDAFQSIIDSGRLIDEYDFINNDDDTDYDPGQDVGSQPYHGTLTWSTLGGEASGHLYGPAYLASFVLAKTEDVTSERHIEEDNWAAGAEWADNLGASVISASLGYKIFDSGEGDYSYSDLDGNTTIVTQAADLAAYNGIAVATAMGNEGNSPGSLIAPADGDSVIACGAVNSSGNLAYFSSWGPTSDGRTKPEVCARGVSTVCVDPYDPSNYGTASGTSLSTPLVGGVCAILFSAHPNWTPMMVREALMMTADRSDLPDNEYGWGVVDAGRALYFHPDGDIVFEHAPILLSGANQAIDIDAHVAGGAGITGSYLYYRVDGSGDYIEIAMTTSNGEDFSGQIPGQIGSYIQYYLKAVDADGSHAFHPVGGENHPMRINLSGWSIADGFEDGPQLWITGGEHDLWGISASYTRTGNLSISDSPTTNYRNNTDSWLESAFSLDLSNSVGAGLSFWYRGVLLSGDNLSVEVSTDGGTVWNPLPQTINGSFPSFTEYSGDLTSYAGQSDVRIRFHLVTNGSGSEEGIYLDDISIDIIADSVPTLSQWGMILFVLFMVMVATLSVIVRRRREVLLID